MAQNNNHIVGEVRREVEQLRELSASLESLVGNFKL